MNKDTQLHLSKIVLHPKGGDSVLAGVAMTSLGVIVSVGNKDSDRLSWDQLDDVEYLADFFWELPVWQFRAVVALLAQALAAKGALVAEAVME
jgi:hypothetical protein